MRLVAELAHGGLTHQLFADSAEYRSPSCDRGSTACGVMRLRPAPTALSREAGGRYLTKLPSGLRVRFAVDADIEYVVEMIRRLGEPA